MANAGTEPSTAVAGLHPFRPVRAQGADLSEAEPRNGRARRALRQRRGAGAADRTFSRGDRGVDFFFVLEGAIEILDIADGTPHVLRAHVAHQFTGELDQLNDRQVLVGGRTGPASRVVRVKRASPRGDAR